MIRHLRPSLATYRIEHKTLCTAQQEFASEALHGASSRHMQRRADCRPGRLSDAIPEHGPPGNSQGASP